MTILLQPGALWNAPGGVLTSDDLGRNQQLRRAQDLPQENCEAAHRLLDEHIAHVGTRIAELQQLERQLKLKGS
jgi:hypothetical protein